MPTPRNGGLRIDALRYSNLESTIGPDGTSVYSFAFDLKATNGAMYRLTARYSDFRRLAYKELLAAYPDAYDWMPRFPPKNPLAKQTPAFLLARGRGLETYLGALLGDPRLSESEPIRALLAMARVVEEASGDADGEGSLIPTSTPSAHAVTATTAMQRATFSALETVGTTSGLEAWQARAVVASAEVAAASSWAAWSLAVVFEPATSLGIALMFGVVYEQAVLYVCCCLLGLTAGHVCKRLWLAPPKNGKVHAPMGKSISYAQPRFPPAAAATSAAAPAAFATAPQEMQPAAAVAAASEAAGRSIDAAEATANGSVDAAAKATEVQLRAASEAVEANRVFEASMPHKESDGWRFFATKEDVDVYLNVRPNGTGTWGMGIGRIPATVATVQEVHDMERFKGVLDKQWESTKLLGEVPPSLISIAGWEVNSCTIQQSLYRSPAWPVAPRESCTVMVKMRCLADGGVRLLHRSFDFPGCTPPEGYVRVSLDVGGYSLTPIRPHHLDGLTEMLYLNILDPNGSIPSVVVKKTVPERALSVARVRKCCAELAKSR